MKSGNDITRQLNRIIKIGQNYRPTYNNEKMKKAIRIADRYIMNLKRYYAYDYEISLRQQYGIRKEV